MKELAINPLVVTLGSPNTNLIKPIAQVRHGSTVKSIIGVVASIAIPYVAPIISSALSLSAGISAITAGFVSSTAATTLASAFAGAALGTVSALVSGQSLQAGALIGAIGGGIGGYLGASGAGATGGAGTAAGTANTGGTAAGLATGGTGGAVGTGGTGGAVGILGASGSVITPQATSANLLGKATNFLSKVGNSIVSKITDPNTLAEITLKAGGQLLATTLIPGANLSPEEQRLVDLRSEELAELKKKDEVAFRHQLQIAKQFLVEAKHYDPHYTGLQSANRTSISQGRKLREYNRTAGLDKFRNTGAYDSAQRRTAIEGSRGIQSSYDSGYQKGLALRNENLVNASKVHPRGDFRYEAGLGGLQNAFGSANARAARERENITELFGELA